MVRRYSYRSYSLLLLLWVLIGLFVAFDRGYVTASLLKALLSAILAIVLWPLVLLGIDMKID